MNNSSISIWEYGFLKWILPTGFGGIIGILFVEYLGIRIIEHYPNDFVWFGILFTTAIIWCVATMLSMKKILKFIPHPNTEIKK